ncbi:baculo_p74_N domain-containing protein [Trichonephila clavipes]|nr:baculo_p74_N domain-containing protein [Trichonephila clavipes]
MATPTDAEWWGARCVMVNPLKKVLASFPEQVFGMQSKHPLHAVPSHPAVSLEVNLSDTIPLPDTSQVAREVTAELLADFGVDIEAHVVEKVLRKIAPQLLLKAAGNLPIQLALTEAVLNQTLSLSVKSLATVGKIMAGASNILAIYSVISVILDIMDPFHYENVLTSDALDAINKRLCVCVNLLYFQQKNNFNPEVTPEMVWANLLGGRR